MDAGTAGGTLTTRPVRFTGKHLFVNLDAPDGELTAEVLAEGGQVIGPFSRANSTPARGDGTIRPVRWEGVHDLSAVAGKPVRFRFHLKRGNLYAFWVSPTES